MPLQMVLAALGSGKAYGSAGKRLESARLALPACESSFSVWTGRRGTGCWTLTELAVACWESARNHDNAAGGCTYLSVLRRRLPIAGCLRRARLSSHLGEGIEVALFKTHGVEADFVRDKKDEAKSLRIEC
jgi:hypothetical protein